MDSRLSILETFRLRLLSFLWMIRPIQNQVPLLWYTLTFYTDWLCQMISYTWMIFTCYAHFTSLRHLSESPDVDDAIQHKPCLALLTARLVIHIVVLWLYRRELRMLMDAPNHYIDLDATRADMTTISENLEFIARNTTERNQWISSCIL